MASERRFAEVRRMLEKAGYRLVRVSGSHHLFEKPGQQLVSIPVHRGKVKPYYARQVDNIVEKIAEPEDEPRGDAAG